MPRQAICPDRETLKRLLKHYPQCEIAKAYGVSGSAVGKWKRKLKLQRVKPMWSKRSQWKRTRILIKDRTNPLIRCECGCQALMKKYRVINRKDGRTEWRERHFLVGHGGAAHRRAETERLKIRKERGYP